MKLKTYFTELIRENSARIGLFFLLSMLYAGITSLIPLISGEFIDGLVNEPTIDLIINFSITILILGLVNIVSSYVLNMYKVKMQVDFGTSFNFRIIKHIQDLDLSFMLQKNPVYISQRINADSNVIVGFILNNISQTTISSLQFLIVLVYIFWTNPLIGSIILLLDVVYVIFYFLVKKKIEQYKYELKDSTAVYSTSLQSQLTKLKFMKASSLNDMFHNNLMSSIKKLRVNVVKNQKLTFWIQSGEMIIFMVVQVTLFCIGGIEIINNRMTVGEFTVLLSYTSILLSATKYFATLSNVYLDAKVSMERIDEFLKIQPFKKGVERVDNIETIDIQNMTFAFNEPLIENFSYIFEQNNIYCIKGDNGSGKTTIMDLVDGFYYSLANGFIYINKIELSDLDIKKYRLYNIAYHLQQSDIIEGEFLEAITYDCESYNQSFMEYMIKGFGLEHFYAENVKAETLSGGEKQKISLIRTILRDTQIILLDEPEVGLDKSSKDFLSTLLNEIKEKKIIIMVTHNDNLLGSVDKIIHLDSKVR